MLTGFQAPAPAGHPGQARRVLQEGCFVSVSPAKFVEEVRAEAKKVTWPTRRATLMTTGAVLAMAGLASVFFFLVDEVIGLGVRKLFGLGG
ncbi:preprotein translocase subunit SecE [Gluconacetobacter entanii]|uniref:Protein translocase subunit SecE n=3 Tax=Acetobacteraceae TaxID=433 RepID=A0A2S3W3E2_9PROT|nr:MULTISPECIES: preprotein translocase subunit SecE [Acetobacteraceae]MCE2578590.1 preprotein translocase subunit SecE [Komagataeibacter sp. FNDCR1]MCJ8354491.1 preprotein translocase subunit SecE [Novacetimonas hansenii]MCW4581488.1 preprotein translocase subunit SecE [Gluconacetobacter entanii]MCW4584868.1 preprotein translocase subunit SecE [Gluconacetobacter entanii]MCW4588281.1 preprotein translocase subunit SecE [Gluconacetobacter entanii]